MIVATAGHVDHGKTSLIKQLTGVDTDRLEEEKRRGLSINLGFAYRKADDQNSIAFIDMPGHKSFINNMISGVSGIDLGMLVIAADDGVMPQTLEHLQVLDCLGVEEIVVVITKVDRANRVRISDVRTAVLELLPQSQLFEVSNKAEFSQSGVDLLQRFLDRYAQTLEPRDANGLFRMSIDRAFTVKGSGLVVTGTVGAGTVRVGDNLRLGSGGIWSARVRGIHSQNQKADIGRAGQRCALNIVGDFDKSSVKRGDYLSDSRCISASDRFDAKLKIGGTVSFPIKHMLPVKLYAGAKHVAAKIFILNKAAANQNKRQLVANDHEVVQFVLQQPLLLCHGDRFLVRDVSETIHLGGGVVLMPQALPWRKGQSHRLQYLMAMDQGDALSALLKVVVEAQQLVDFSAFVVNWNLSEQQGKSYLTDQQLQAHAELVALEQDKQRRQYLVPKLALRQMEALLCQHLLTLHCKRPMATGVALIELTRQLPTGDDLLFKSALAGLLKEQVVSINGGLLSMAGHRPTVSSQVQQQWLLVSNLLRKGNFQVPLVSELSRDSGLTIKQLAALINFALKAGDLIKLSEKRYMLTETEHAMQSEIKKIASQYPCFSVIDVKDHLGLGRNITIEILEYFDSTGFTKRKNEGRELAC